MARLIEVHGAVDLYRCSNQSCDYARTKWFDGITFQHDEKGRVVPPTCSECGSLVLPLTLLFDEQYCSHAFFRNDALNDWLDRADAVVFVGTSFSVGVTSAAMSTAAMWGAEVFNFNIEPARPSSATLTAQVTNITGPAELTLPALATECNASQSSFSSSSLSLFSSCSLQ